MNKLISVIMSTKDTEEKVLRQAIDSILNQSYSNFEFIIVCDGSENNYRILKKYNDKRIKIIKNDISIGLTKSLNKALEIANGDYIARMDSDDISLKNRLLIQLKFMEKRTDIDICSTFAKNIGDSNKFKVDIYNDCEGIKAQLFLYNCLVHPAIMIRRRFIEKNNIKYDESFKYSQDYELWSRCSKIGKIHIIPKICLMYRVHNKQISTLKIDEQNLLCKHIYVRNLEELNINNKEEKSDILLYLCGRININLDYNKIVDLLKEIIEKNNILKIYNTKKLKKILYLKLAIFNFKHNNKKNTISMILKYNLIVVILKKLLLLCYYKINWLFIEK